MQLDFKAKHMNIVFIVCFEFFYFFCVWLQTQILELLLLKTEYQTEFCNLFLLSAEPFLRYLAEASTLRENLLSESVSQDWPPV